MTDLQIAGVVIAAVFFGWLWLRKSRPGVESSGFIAQNDDKSPRSSDRR